MHKERRKCLGRYDKDFILSIASEIKRTDPIGHNGYASLIKINEVAHPFMIGEKGAEICIADVGYSELTFLPDNEKWMLTAIYDNHGAIVEWYFDITRKNALDENGTPYCDDLYLDAALMPDGRILIFDEDELQAARDSGFVTPEEFDMAYTVLKRLIADKIIDVAYMQNLCEQLMALFLT